MVARIGGISMPCGHNSYGVHLVLIVFPHCHQLRQRQQHWHVIMAAGNEHTAHVVHRRLNSVFLCSSNTCHIWLMDCPLNRMVRRPVTNRFRVRIRYYGRITGTTVNRDLCAWLQMDHRRVVEHKRICGSPEYRSILFLSPALSTPLSLNSTCCWQAGYICHRNRIPNEPMRYGYLSLFLIPSWYSHLLLNSHGLSQIFLQFTINIPQ